MEEKPLDLLLNSKSAFYTDWRGVVLGLLITTIIVGGFGRSGNLTASLFMERLNYHLFNQIKEFLEFQRFYSGDI